MSTKGLCSRCGKEWSSKWWKCCPEHTTEQGPDKICTQCYKKLHPPPEKLGTVSSSEFVEQTGITYRQLDYWCRQGILPVASGEANPGSGKSRRFDEDLVEKVKLVGRVCKALSKNEHHSQISLSLLKKVLDNYDRGYIDLGEDIILGWK